MQTSKANSRDLWAADSLIACLTEAKQDGTLEKLSNRWQTIDLDIDQATQTLSTLETQIERKDFIAFSCPYLYLSIR